MPDYADRMSPEGIEAWKRARESRVMDEIEAKEWCGRWGGRLVAFREAGLVSANAVRRQGGFIAHMYVQRNLREHVAGWVTEQEAQELTGRKARTLRRWRTERLVEARPMGRAWVYREKSLMSARDEMVENVQASREYAS